MSQPRRVTQPTPAQHITKTRTQLLHIHKSPIHKHSFLHTSCSTSPLATDPPAGPQPAGVLGARRFGARGTVASRQAQCKFELWRAGAGTGEAGGCGGGDCTCPAQPPSAALSRPRHTLQVGVGVGRDARPAATRASGSTVRLLCPLTTLCLLRRLTAHPTPLPAPRCCRAAPRVLCGVGTAGRWGTCITASFWVKPPPLPFISRPRLLYPLSCPSMSLPHAPSHAPHSTCCPPPPPLANLPPSYPNSPVSVTPASFPSTSPLDISS
ncbi:hypothetical protein E2C01_079016 [Portunus trituberculatus]|uniref:Uncharacterized protein n=1 Tax=Portunus trituberculatus TaxID=210409 RepID=A0A5B7IPH6_PORTR|nr:hypothetical protein [Portunus trituberculatus]